AAPYRKGQVLHSVFAAAISKKLPLFTQRANKPARSLFARNWPGSAMQGQVSAHRDDDLPVAKLLRV
ncbi:hypothetical protein, partial [Pseudomonas sp. BIOMIG1BD]|uniref:hypothetical protein n=1 Tax=Pseudomonas sp. BIOMIG1BD TaxID=1758731 RepID=UPI0019D3D42F